MKYTPDQVIEHKYTLVIVTNDEVIVNCIHGFDVVVEQVRFYRDASYSYRNAAISIHKNICIAMTGCRGVTFMETEWLDTDEAYKGNEVVLFQNWEKPHCEVAKRGEDGNFKDATKSSKEAVA